MPPRSQPRTVLAELSLARRIAFEREQREWSPAGLALRMTKAGCPMTQSAIWKIENGDPPRRITFDEAVTFAGVFDVSLDELASPPDVVAAQSVADAARAIVWKVESLDNLMNEEIRLNLADLLARIEGFGASDLIARALTRIARGELGDPWEASDEQMAKAREELPDLRVIEDWLLSMSEQLRDRARDAENLADNFSFWAERRLGLDAMVGEGTASDG